MLVWPVRNAKRMASEQLKGLLFEWLNKPENRRSLNFDTCATGIAWLAKDRYPDLLHKGTKDGVVLLADTAKLNLVEIVWDLIIGRVLIPGDQSNAWPTLSITAHGEQVIRDQKPTPYD